MANKLVSGMLYFSSDSSDDEILGKNIPTLKPKIIGGMKSDLNKKSGSETIQNIYTKQIGKFANNKKNFDKTPMSIVSANADCENLSSDEDIPEKLQSKKPIKKGSTKQAKANVRLTSNSISNQSVIENLNEVLKEETLGNNISGRLRSRTRKGKSSPVVLDSSDVMASPVLKHKSPRKGFSKTMNALDENLKLFDNTIESVYVSGSDEEIVDEITIRIQCLSKIKKIRMKLNQEFSTITEELAQELGVNKSDICIYFGSDKIYPTDTPMSRSISTSEILYCYTGSQVVEASTNVNEIELTVQSTLHKKKITFKCDKTKPLRQLAEEFATKNNIAVNKVILKFDGELIDLEESAEDLDIENGDCIDIVVR